MHGYNLCCVNVSQLLTVGLCVLANIVTDNCYTDKLRAEHRVE